VNRNRLQKRYFPGWEELVLTNPFLMQSNLLNQAIPVRTTVLFIEGIPVGYKIYKNGAVYFLYPSEIPGTETKAPLIMATHYNGQWEVEEKCDQNLADQVMEDLNLLISEPVLVSPGQPVLQ
jgi:hypothetical protein